MEEPTSDAAERSPPPSAESDIAMHTLYGSIREKQLEEQRLAEAMAGSTRSAVDTATDNLDHAHEVLSEILQLKSSSDIQERLKESAIPYIEQTELEVLLRSKRASVIVVDTREDDRCGGHVKGSLHCPGNDFAQHVERLTAMLDDGEKKTVVFHCMESVMRGPRCALGFDSYLCISKQDAQYLHPRICVLRGGFDQWCRKHYTDPQLVEVFDDEFWGFGNWNDHDKQEDRDDTAGGTGSR
jgi:Cdc25 family phosphatase